MKFKYAILEHDPKLEDQFGPVKYDVLGGNESHSAHWAAEECAQHFWAYHDGWEASWPLTVVLFDEQGVEEFGRFKVEMDLEPTFVTSVVKTAADEHERDSDE